MKKLLFVFIVFVLILPCVVIAEEAVIEVAASVVESEIPTQPFSWEQLATIAGAALATMLIVQLLKLPLDKVWKIPTRIIVFRIMLPSMTMTARTCCGSTWDSCMNLILV